MRRLTLGLSFALVLAGCAGPLETGKAEFKNGRYAEAKETFRRAEDDHKTWDDRRRAEYALYRGLTHGALGDRAASLLWLREAKAIDDAHPGTLTPDDHARLGLALESADPAQATVP